METRTPTPSSVAIPVICMECKKRFVVTVLADDYLKWKQGMLIQKAFPYLSAEIRELLISNICPDCWNIMFKDIEDD